MLVLLPASDRKAPVGGSGGRVGTAFDPDGLSFPPLAPTRAAVLDALLAVSAEPDAMHLLAIPSTMGDVLDDNLDVRNAPTTPVERLYAGVLYDAIGLADLDAASRRRARSWIVVISALWGAVRLGDRIPRYRLDMCGRLPGLAHLTDVWRGPLDTVLPSAAGRGLVVDCRSAEYATAWRPTGELAERTVVLRVVSDGDRARGAAGHGAKRTRGRVVRRIVTGAIDPRLPADLAEALADRFEVDLHVPRRDGGTWTLDVVGWPE